MYMFTVKQNDRPGRTNCFISRKAQITSGPLSRISTLDPYFRHIADIMCTYNNIDICVVVLFIVKLEKI